MKEQIWIRDGEIIMNEQVVNELLEENKKLKEKVLKFEKILNDAEKDGCINITTNDTRDVFKDIFGDFEK
jgi:hypothetical protein